jgi:hypothetical protein
VSTDVHVRGWVECGPAQFRQVEAILATHDDGHYAGDWGVPRQWVNAYVQSAFFAGILPVHYLDWLRAQLEAIAAIPADEDGDRVHGLFFVHHDLDGPAEWQVRDGQLHVLPRDPRHAFLDA